MAQHPNSRANLKSNNVHPIGYKKKTKNGYWRVKVSGSEWKYTHVELAERQLGRPLNPNERVYFTNDRANKKDPQPGDIEVRIVAIRSGRPPGRRSFYARRVLDLRQKLKDAEENLAAHNRWLGRPEDDTSGAFETREWNGKQ